MRRAAKIRAINEYNSKLVARWNDARGTNPNSKMAPPIARHWSMAPALTHG